jgi:hypothetical protein
VDTGPCPPVGGHILRKALIVAALMLAATAHTASADMSSAQLQGTVPVATTNSQPTPLQLWRSRVRAHRVAAVRYAASLGVRIHPGRIEMSTTGIPYLQWMSLRWRHRANALLAVRSRRFPALLCIHHYEGSWVAYSPAGYYGGFQMSLTFMRHWGADKLAKYGGRDARYWSAADQMAVASRAVAHLGYSPWPNTAAICGLY